MSGDPESQIAKLLSEHGGFLVRTKRHNVWRFPDGKLFVRSKSPSDRWAAANSLGDLRRLLGIKEERQLSHERSEYGRKPGRAQTHGISRSMSDEMLSAMRKAGLIEDGLHQKIANLTIELRASRRANGRRRRQLAAYNRHCKRCWGCALSRLWIRLWTRVWRALVELESRARGAAQ